MWHEPGARRGRGNREIDSLAKSAFHLRLTSRIVSSLRRADGATRAASECRWCRGLMSIRMVINIAVVVVGSWRNWSPCFELVSSP